METPFGLIHVWSQGDLVTRSVFAVLVFMSLVSWVVILVKALGVVKDCEQSGVWGEAAAGWRAALTAGEVVRQWSPTFRSRCIHVAGSGLEAGSLFMPKSVPDVRDEIQFRPCKVRKATEWLRPSRTTPDAESPPRRHRCTDLGL